MMETPHSPLRIAEQPQTLRTIVTAQLRDAIVGGHFRSGDRLVERSLCDQLGVSRTVVRETIRTLEAEGLVEIPSNRGPIVARLDWAQARQIYRIRLLLEADAAADCARIATPAIIADLREGLDLLGAAYGSGQTGQLFAATTEFYRRIFVHAGHEISWDVVNRLNGRISRLRAMTLSTADRHRAGFAEMRRIFDAIAVRDWGAAERAVRDHIEDASEIARRQLTETPL